MKRSILLSSHGTLTDWSSIPAEIRKGLWARLDSSTMISNSVTVTLPDTSNIFLNRVFAASRQQFRFYSSFFIFYHKYLNNEHFFTFSPNFSDVMAYFPLTPFIINLYSLVVILRSVKYKFSIILQQIQPF